MPKRRPLRGRRDRRNIIHENEKITKATVVPEMAHFQESQEQNRIAQNARASKLGILERIIKKRK